MVADLLKSWWTHFGNRWYRRLYYYASCFFGTRQLAVLVTLPSRSGIRGIAAPLAYPGQPNTKSSFVQPVKQSLMTEVPGSRNDRSMLIKYFASRAHTCPWIQVVVDSVTLPSCGKFKVEAHPENRPFWPRFSSVPGQKGWDSTSN